MGLEHSPRKSSVLGHTHSQDYWVSVNAAHVVQQPEEMAGPFLRVDGFNPCISTNLLVAAGFACSSHSSYSACVPSPASIAGKKKDKKGAVD